MGDYYEFFAGGGMARAGLGAGWNCLFANDFDPMKADAYRANWGGEHLHVEDINTLTTAALKGKAQLAWASFPCQDLSGAGNQNGIGHWASGAQTRSGTFWPFIRLMRELKEERRAPEMIVLENVPGTLTANGGKDFVAICSAFSGLEYRFGAVIIDASLWVPQSRARMFMIGVRSDIAIPPALKLDAPGPHFHTDVLLKSHRGLTPEAQRKWIWWNVKAPPIRKTTFTDLIEDEPQGVRWHNREETRRLLRMMSVVNRAKVAAAVKLRHRIVGGVYKRTRLHDGLKQQRAEVRFDDVAGCLRTPAGGSSRQTLLVIDKGKIRSRLLSPREAARLMGLPDSYKLPENYNDAYHVAGDGVVVPVVRHIARTILSPIQEGQRAPALKIA
jgi:DNA (cytosine-5)-methyltransferase 1